MSPSLSETLLQLIILYCKDNANTLIVNCIAYECGETHTYKKAQQEIIFANVKHSDYTGHFVFPHM